MTITFTDRNAAAWNAASQRGFAGLPTPEFMTAVIETRGWTNMAEIVLPAMLGIVGPLATVGWLLFFH